MSSENISIEICKTTHSIEPNDYLGANVSTNGLNPIDHSSTEFGFTRYLYIIDDVKSSLVIAILERNLEESLFWAYELYFSGFKIDVFCILEQMVDMMFIPLNPQLGIFLEKKKRGWDESGEYCVVGTFIYNMVNRSYDISAFVKKFCKDPELIRYVDLHTITAKPGMAKNIYITIEQKDVVKYITVNNDKPHYLLKKTVKYPVRKNTLAIFNHEHGIYSHDRIQYIYWYHWLYYACLSPIWSDRISKYGGNLNHDQHIVYFYTDEQADAFHKKYNLEPDEQSKQLQEMNIGTGIEEQMSWTEFYEKYT